jgi:SNF2 family DNA or RNA helicase
LLRIYSVTIYSVLDILSDFCDLKEYKFCRIDGQVKIEERKSLIYDFNHDESIKLFLISTRAGGLGINLVGADTVIYVLFAGYYI